MYLIQGGCHCGNITYQAEIANAPSSYAPRACDCKLCTSHAASYISDSHGTLTITVNDENNVSKYRQGSKIAYFLICKKCGVMTGVCYEENGRIYGSINTRSTDNQASFGAVQVAQLTQLTDEERIARWKNIWFSNVD